MQVGEQEERTGRAAAAVSVALTAVVALGLGWITATAFGEPPSDRWGRAGGVAASVVVIALVTPWVRRRQSRRETSRGRILCGLIVVEGTVPGLGARWTMGRATVMDGRVDFDRGRFSSQPGRGTASSFTVSSHGQPRGSTWRESLRVGTDAKVVDLVSSTGARVRLAAVLPESLTPALAALDARR